MLSATLACLSACGRMARCRGMCEGCYKRLRLAVATGETTWAQLEAEGRARAAQPAGSAWQRWRLRARGRDLASRLPPCDNSASGRAAS